MKFTEGGLARLLTDLILLPFTVLKTRYESGQFAYRSLWGALNVTYRSEGVRGLYSGITPTLLRDVPFSGLYLAIYTTMKKSLALGEYDKRSLTEPRTGERAAGWPTVKLFMCAALSGIFASVITQPFDVVKTYMQLSSTKYATVSDCARWVYSNQGVRGFLSGTIPRCARRTLMTAVAWTLYERILLSLGMKNSKAL